MAAGKDRSVRRASDWPDIGCRDWLVAAHTQTVAQWTLASQQSSLNRQTACRPPCRNHDYLPWCGSRSIDEGDYHVMKWIDNDW